MLLTIALYGNHRGRLIGLQAIVNQVWGWSLLHYTVVHKYSYLGNTIIFIIPYNFVDKSPQALGFPNKLCCSSEKDLHWQGQYLCHCKYWSASENWWKWWKSDVRMSIDISIDEEVLMNLRVGLPSSASS